MGGLLVYQLEKLIDRIIDRVNINLRKPAFDVGPYLRHLIPLDQFVRFYAFYGLTLHHPIHFHFNGSSIAGSYFLGKSTVDHCVLYKTDVRGDELKARGDVFKYETLEIPLHDDEVIRIKDSYLIKNLVHNHSHDPESPEEFFIQNTASMHYANIHGSPVEGSFLGPFSTVDLTRLHDCVIGAYAYVQTGELAHSFIDPGQILIDSGDCFKFIYRFPRDVLERYIHLEPGKKPAGIFMDFVEGRKIDFEKVFEVVHSVRPIPVPEGASLSRYAVVKGETGISENVLVAQRAYLENCWLGKGSNAQENCCIVASRLEGRNITAHGAKVLHAKLGEKVFVGFNSFLRGSPKCELNIGAASIVMPHTIIDVEEPLEIAEGRLVWGYIRNRKDLERHSLPLETLAGTKNKIELGAMSFEGSGFHFVEAFVHRIEHILQANGAYFDGSANRGHAQNALHISFNTIQPYPEGILKGIYPTIDICP
ncbi:MAG: transferase [Syntrophobacteraceae bacterium]|jgi:carbonic anhydrase/acetyltransferase-like protein (isoleucine patch superfamily)